MIIQCTDHLLQRPADWCAESGDGQVATGQYNTIQYNKSLMEKNCHNADSEYKM